MSEPNTNKIITYDMVMHLENHDVTIITSSKTPPKDPKIVDGYYLIYCTNSTYKIMTKELKYNTVNKYGKISKGQNYFYAVPVGDVIEFETTEHITETTASITEET